MEKILGKYDFPDALYYSKDHMWARIEDGQVRVGLTDFGQSIAGKILMVKSRPLGKIVGQGKILGTMETGKWVGPLRNPVSGEILKTNDVLRIVKNAELVNKDPYGEGWMFIIKPANLENDLKILMTDNKEIEGWLKEEIKNLEAEEQGI